MLRQRASCLREPQDHLQSLLELLAGPSPTVSAVGGLGWDKEFAFLTSAQVMAKLVGRGTCFENHRSKVLPVWKKQVGLRFSLPISPAPRR